MRRCRLAVLLLLPIALTSRASAFEPTDGSAAFICLAAAFILVAVGYALYNSRARLRATDGGIPWQPPYPGVACPPPGSNTIVVAPTPSILAAFIVGMSLTSFGAVLASIYMNR